jgi:hypothetical protein
MQIGSNERGQLVTIDVNDLTTHGVILGRSGSGKTGATVVTIEEAVLSGASAIILDPKGDLTNLALAFPGLEAGDFSPWMGRNKDPVEAAERARKNLGSLYPNVRRWKEAADVTIYAPGKTQGGGKSVNLLPSFSPPTGSYSAQGLRDRASAVITSILNALGHSADPLTDPANVFLTDVMVNAWKRGQSLGLEEWAGLLSNPPKQFHTIDGLPLDEFFPKRKRMKIARAVVGFRRQATKWLTGSPLSVESYVGVDKPKVSIFTMRHLDEGERQFFSSMLLSAITDYMFRAPASDDLRLLVVLDEARGYLPPSPKNPPTKAPICTLLAQGRAQGIGMLIGTQNPNEMDYKALTNVGTWFLGRMRIRDLARDLKKELQDRGVESSTLTNIPQQSFMILKRTGEHITTKIRWAYSYLRGPMNGSDLLKLEEGFFKVKTAACVRTGDVTFVFSLFDPESRTAKIAAEFSLDNGRTWKPASIRNPTVPLTSSPEGTKHVVVWDTIADLNGKKATVLAHTLINNYQFHPSTLFMIDNSNVRETLLAASRG